MVGVMVKSDILPTLKGKNPLVRSPDMGAYLNGTGAETNNIAFETYEAFCNVEIFIKGARDVG